MDIDAITHQDTLNIWSDFDTIRDTGCGGGEESVLGVAFLKLYRI